MKKKFDDINDDEIRIIGADSQPRPRLPKWVIAGGVAVIVLLMIGAILLFYNTPQSEDENIELSYFEEQPATNDSIESAQLPKVKPLSQHPDSVTASYTEVLERTVNDIPLRIYIPHNAIPSLHVGQIPYDNDIVLIAQAADIRRDNKKIVGAFVLKGKPLAWGLSKTGYCAIINDTLTVGTAQNSPLFERATEQEGYFFRQYPLVNNGALVENEPKNKSIRRALCDRAGEIFIVESLTPESFHDFAQALVDLGIEQAIYLVGSSAYGYATDLDGNRTTFGTPRRAIPANISYILWRKSSSIASAI